MKAFYFFNGFMLLFALAILAFEICALFQPYHETCQSTVIVEFENDLEKDSFSVAYSVDGEVHTATISGTDFYAYKAGAPAETCTRVGSLIGITYTTLRRIEQ